MALNHTCISVKDMERSLAFYRDGLGLKVTADLELSGPEVDTFVQETGARLRSVMLQSERGTKVQILEWHSPPLKVRPPEEFKYAETGIVEICLEVPDIDELGKKLAKRGLKFRYPPILFQGRSKIAHVVDPDGIIVEIMETPDINHSAISVTNMERSLAFYRDGLGLKVTADLELSGPEVDTFVQETGARFRVVMARGETGGQLEILEWYSPPVRVRPPKDFKFSKTGIVEICLEVPDLDKLEKGLKEKGLSFRYPPFFFQGRTKMTHIVDPDGIIVELIEVGKRT